MLGPVKRLFENLTDLKGEDLIPNEEVIYSTNRVWFSEFMMIIVAVLAIMGAVGLFIYGVLTKVSGIWQNLLNIFSIVCFVAGIAFSIGLLLDHYGTRYFLTNHRVIKRTGVLSKKLIYVQYDKIQNVKISKSIGERIVDMGDIHIDTAGGDQVEMAILDIPDPEKMHTLILDMMEKEHAHRGP